MMEGSEAAAPTEDTVKALMEYLVDPVLPLRPKAPSLTDRRSVAKQMHAVVILYNYYHRKQHPELQFLDYRAFCKLAVSVKPVLSTHMNLTNLSAEALANDWGRQPSLTEQTIMDACSISSSLEALGDVPNVTEWPIAKVSVLLVDSKKDTCLLQFDSITGGSWSVIEQGLDEKETDTSRFLHFVVAAIKRAKGIQPSKLALLDSHVVYCLSKEKTSAYFYIMQCTDSSQDFEVPIKDAIDSLEGPLVRWIAGSWNLTQVVEYYDVLPYATIMSSWYSRRASSNASECLSESILALEDASDGDYRQVSDISDQRSNCTDKCKTGKIDIQEVQKPNKSVPVTSSLTVGKKPKRKYTSRKSSVATHLSLEKLEKGDGDARETNSTAEPKVVQLENCTVAASKIADITKEIIIDKSLDITQPAEEAICKETQGVEIDVQEIENSDAQYNSREEMPSDECHQNTENSDKSWDITHHTKEGLLEETRALSKQPIDPVDFISRLNEVEETDHSDKPLNANHSDFLTLGTNDTNGSEQHSPRDLQIIHSPARKKQKTDCSIVTNSLEKENINKNSEVPSIFCYQKQMISQGETNDVNLDGTAVEETDIASVLAKRDVALTQIALEVLYKKKANLVHQQHILDSEIALCDKNITKIIEGKEGSLGVKLDAIIDGCKVMLRKDMTRKEDHQAGRREA